MLTFRGDMVRYLFELIWVNLEPTVGPTVYYTFGSSDESDSNIELIMETNIWKSSNSFKHENSLLSTGKGSHWLAMAKVMDFDAHVKKNKSLE